MRSVSVTCVVDGAAHGKVTTRCMARTARGTAHGTVHGTAHGTVHGTERVACGLLAEERDVLLRGRLGAAARRVQLELRRLAPLLHGLPCLAAVDA